MIGPTNYSLFYQFMEKTSTTDTNFEIVKQKSHSTANTYTN